MSKVANIGHDEELVGDHKESKIKRMLSLGSLTGLAFFALCYLVLEAMIIDFSSLYDSSSFLFITYPIGELKVNFFWPIPLIAGVIIAAIVHFYFRSWKEALGYALVSLGIGPVAFNFYYFYIAHPASTGAMADAGYPITEAILSGICMSAAFFIAGGLTGLVPRAVISSRILNIESQVLDYIVSNNNRIRILECAGKIGVTKEQVEETLGKLREKGKIVLRSRRTSSVIPNPISGETEGLDLEKKISYLEEKNAEMGFLKPEEKLEYDIAGKMDAGKSRKEAIEALYKETT